MQAVFWTSSLWSQKTTNSRKTKSTKRSATCTFNNRTKSRSTTRTDLRRLLLSRSRTLRTPRSADLSNSWMASPRAHSGSTVPPNSKACPPTQPRKTCKTSSSSTPTSNFQRMKTCRKTNFYAQKSPRTMMTMTKKKTRFRSAWQLRCPTSTATTSTCKPTNLCITLCQACARWACLTCSPAYALRCSSSGKWSMTWRTWHRAITLRIWFHSTKVIAWLTCRSWPVNQEVPKEVFDHAKEHQNVSIKTVPLYCIIPSQTHVSITQLDRDKNTVKLSKQMV